MLLLSLITTIVTLLWSVQFFTTIHSESVLIWLNLIMIITWITLLLFTLFMTTYIQRTTHSKTHLQNIQN